MRRRRLSVDVAERIIRLWQQKVHAALRAPELTDDERGFWSFAGLARYYSVRANDLTWLTVLGRTTGERAMRPIWTAWHSLYRGMPPAPFQSTL